MITPDGTHTRTRYARLTALLGLCAVVFLQIETASHAEHEHSSPGSHEEICEVCLKLDKSGSVPLAVSAATIVGCNVSPPTRWPALTFATRTKDPHSARGPPAA